MIEIDLDLVRELLPKRTDDSHKGDSGTVLVVGGCEMYRGAPTLATAGALHTGAGLVAVASIEKVIQVTASHFPEAIYISSDSNDNCLTEEWYLPITQFIDIKPRAVIAVGPGLGSSLSTAKLLERLFASLSSSMIIDADALNMIAKGVRLPASPCVLTPHPGEMERLVGVHPDRESSIRACADKYGKTCLLKGNRTLVSDESGSIYVNSTGNSGMATGGMGDVLTGIIASFVGQGLSPTNAALCGVFLHGHAGDLCLKEFGLGYTPSDLARMLPKALSSTVIKA